MSIEQGLAKTRGGFFSRLIGRAEQSLTAEWLDSLEEALLRADLSVSLVDPLMAQLRDLFNGGELKTVPKALTAVRDTLVAALAGDVRLRGEGQKPRVILVVGVNGSGKTTTAAKLAKRLKDSGERRSSLRPTRSAPLRSSSWSGGPNAWGCRSSRENPTATRPRSSSTR